MVAYTNRASYSKFHPFILLRSPAILHNLFCKTKTSVTGDWHVTFFLIDTLQVLQNCEKTKMRIRVVSEFAITTTVFLTPLDSTYANWISHTAHVFKSCMNELHIGIDELGSCSRALLFSTKDCTAALHQAVAFRNSFANSLPPVPFLLSFSSSFFSPVFPPRIYCFCRLNGLAAIRKSTLDQKRLLKWPAAKCRAVKSFYPCSA